jgi:hypothetical protein
MTVDLSEEEKREQKRKRRLGYMDKYRLRLKLEKARLRHLHIVREVKRNGRSELLTGQEKGWE